MTDNPENKRVFSPFYKEARKLAWAEFREIKGLIPLRGTSLEERTRRNTIIREKLPSLSMETLSLLFKEFDHDLSAREIETRLNKDLSNLEDLLLLGCNLGHTYTAKRCRRLTVKMQESLIRRAENFDPEEIIARAEEYDEEIIMRLNIFEQIISQRSDRNVIIEKLKSRGLYKRCRNGDDWLERFVEFYAQSSEKNRY